MTAGAFGPDHAPLAALADADVPGVMAVITGVEGPSYRPLGAVMALFADDRHVGTLSSGCVEADLALHAANALADGNPATVRYGRGSPFIDIQLPCGGGLEILLVPQPDKSVLGQVCETLRARKACALAIDVPSGALGFESGTETGRSGDTFRIFLEPELNFLVFGKGPEASTFAALAQSAGYPNLLLSPDEETLEAGRAAGCDTRHMVRKGMPDGVEPDPWTSVTLFFHDHDWEPQILMKAITSPAFYVGAQGSRRARAARDLELEAMGLNQAEIGRIHGPIGLVPSARDARTLAVSVLAEVLDAARTVRRADGAMA